MQRRWMRRLFSSLLVLWALPVWADCVTLDTSGWTPEQQSRAIGAGAALASLQGDVTVKGASLCVEGVELAKTVNEETVLQRITEDLALQATEQAQLAQDEAALKAVTEALTSDAAKWDRLTQQQKFEVVGRLVQREVLKERLGQ